MDGNAARLATVLATDVLLLPTVALTVLLPAEKATRERARKAACLSTREKRTNGIRPQNRTPWGRYLNADAILKIPLCTAFLSCCKSRGGTTSLPGLVPASFPFYQGRPYAVFFLFFYWLGD